MQLGSVSAKYTSLSSEHNDINTEKGRRITQTTVVKIDGINHILSANKHYDVRSHWLRDYHNGLHF
jgi:hypothetical protein